MRNLFYSRNTNLLSLVFFALMLVVVACKTAEVAPAPAPVKSAAKEITKFSFAGLSPAVDGTIDATAKTISATVLLNTDVTKLSPTITISDKATVSPASGTAQNFTNPVNYIVTAEDGTTQTYAVSTVINPPKINTFAPDNGPAGTAVVLNGEGFSDVSTDIKVTINGKNAPVTASNNKQITIQIPERAGSGDIVVDVKGKTAKSPSVFKYKFTATSTTIVSAFNGSLFQSIAIDPDNDVVYASDRRYSGVWVLRPGATAQFITLRDLSGGTFVSLTGITISKTGVGGTFDKLLFVATEDKGTFFYSIPAMTTGISTLNAQAQIQANDAVYSAPTSLVHVSQNPNSVNVSNGTIYFACFGNSTIVRSARKDGVTSSPSIIGAGTGYNTGTVASTNAKFAGPVGVFLKNSLIYVADESNHSIRTVDFDNGRVATLFGTGTAGNVDGNFANVKLNLPSNVVVDDNGLVYITDRGNNSLRVFDPRNQTSQTLLTGLNAPYGLAIDKTGSYLVIGEWGVGTNKVLKVAIK